MSEPTFWGIHAGRTGDGHDLFMNRDVIALGWDRMGDLMLLPQDRDSYKSKLSVAYPEAKTGAVPVLAGQLFRFVNEVREGDIAIYPSKSERLVHIGRVTGPYVYEPDAPNEYAHRRPVEWLDAIQRTAFSQGALYEIGSALSFFQVKNYSDEFQAVVDGETPDAIAEVEDDATVGLVAAEIEATTRDFVMKRLSKELKGYPFEHFVAELFRSLGYKTRVTQASGDKGVDVVAHRDELGIEPPIIKIQAKSTQGTVGDPDVTHLFGKLADGEFGVMVTLGSFSKQARDFAESKGNLRLIDGDEVVRLTLANYELLDSRYKGLIPLRNVYIPEGLDEPEF